MTFKHVLVALSLLTAPPALAHELEKGPNGGRVTDAGSIHIELVAKDTTVTVFVSGADDKPLPAKGYKGVAILTVGGKANRIILVARDDTRLTGVSPVSIGAPPRGVVQLTGPDGKTVQGRFQ